jgi:threonyl-tRNA synthetase
VLRQLKNADIRTEIDDRSEKIGRKIRDTEMLKVPYMFVIGEKEIAENKVSVRKQGKGDTGAIDLSEIISTLKKEIIERQ